jgi:phosphoglycolate phosphatase-like HAD superfamily hydrolase
VDPDWFVVTAFGDEAETRPGLVRRALERQRVRTGRDTLPRDVVVIGDTPKDVACARENACKSLAVATGRFSREDLEAAGASRVVDDLSDPAPLLELLGL